MLCWFEPRSGQEKVTRTLALPSFQVAQPSVPEGELSRPCELKELSSLAGTLTGLLIHLPQERSEPVISIGMPVKLITVARTCRYSYLRIGVAVEAAVFDSVIMA